MTSEKVARMRLMILGVLGAMGLLVWLPQIGSADLRQPGASGNVLQVHYLDVGQGDATLIETPDGIQVLIDGGPNDAVLRELGKQLSFFDKTIDMVIATHPDGDHIGGLIDVLRRYNVQTVVLTENMNDTPTAEAFLRGVENEQAEVVYARAGQSWQLGASTTLSILFPVSDPVEYESNTASIVTRLSYGESDFIFTGDAPQVIEEFLVDEYGTGLQSEVLKVGHHGSKTSTDEAFVATVDPEFAIISAGKNNRYGHPHSEVLNMLSGIETIGTYEAGTISLYSDGAEVWQE